MENKKLDKFHIKEHIREAAHDIAAGNILRSMQVGGRRRAATAGAWAGAAAGRCRRRQARLPRCGAERCSLPHARAGRC